MRRKRRSTTVKNELAQSVDHFRRAATIAAQETGTTVGPKFYAARDRVQPAAVKARGAASSSWDSALATLTPLVAAATESVRQTGKESAKVSKKEAKANRKNARKLEKRANKAVGRKQGGRKTGKLVSLAMVGAAVGAGAAYLSRRRKAAQWDEYDPSEPITSTQQVGADDAAFEPAGDTVTTVSETDPLVAGGTEPVVAADTEPVVAGDTEPAVPADTEPAVAADTEPLMAGEVGDQTSSPQHSPKVARMASGKNSSTTNED